MIIINKPKDIIIQNLRGVFILGVVLAHSLAFNNYYETNFTNLIIRIPWNFIIAWFIFTSAIFIKYNKNTFTKDNLRKYFIPRFKRIIIPFLIWAFIYTCLNLPNNSTSNIYKIIIYFIFGTNTPHLYFIFVLIQLTLLIPFLTWISEKNNSLINIFILLITPIDYLINSFIYYKTGQYISLNKYLFVSWCSYFYLGILIKKSKKTKFSNLTFNIISTLISLIISYIIAIYIFIKTNDINYPTSQMKFINAIYSFSVILLFINLKNINKLNIFNKKCLITKIGDCAYGIFYCHYLFIVLVNAFFTYSFLNITSTIYYPLLVAVISVFISVTFIFICNKYLPKKICAIFGLK